jgi:hypothetical protein
MSSGTSSRAARKSAAKSATRSARKAARSARKAAANPWLERAARAGYVVRGFLYGMMGFLAIQYALNAGSITTDQRGSLLQLHPAPVRTALLLVSVVALSAYAIWGFVRAAFDPLKRGDDATGIVARLGFAWSGLNYGALAVFAAEFLAGRGSGGDSVQSGVRTLMATPVGRPATIAAGLVVIGGGLGQFVDAYKATFRKDLKRNQMNRIERDVADGLGRMGMFSRGVIFTMLGWFVLEAGITANPGAAEGMGGTFVSLAQAPLGHLLLFIVAAGFIALGLHSLASARWIRMLPRD